MLQNISKLTILILFSVNAQAKTLAVQSLPILSMWDVAQVKVAELPQVFAYSPLAIENDCSSSAVERPFALEGISWDEIFTIGEKIWKIIDANKPVVNVTTQVVHALPRGLKCWADLEHWRAPVVKSYEVKYKNGFGMEVVKFRFRLQYNYGGGLGDLGQYIANATVIPAELNVMWGYTFNADMGVDQAVNLGTLGNPLAGLGMNLNWSVKTVFKESRNSFGFFLQGDGVTMANN